MLIAGPTELQLPSGVTCEQIVTTADLLAAVEKHLPQSDVAIFAAAPADYRPATTSELKSAKQVDGINLQLIPTEDVAAWAGQHRRENQILIAFAAETHDGETRAREKMQRKNADFIVLNDISRKDIGFASTENEVLILRRDGARKAIGKTSKAQIAGEIFDSVLR